MLKFNLYYNRAKINPVELDDSEKNILMNKGHITRIIKDNITDEIKEKQIIETQKIRVIPCIVI